MSERPVASSPQFVTCHCEHCGGGIEFDASEFAEHESRAAECPHCHKEAKIFVPVQKLPSGISAEELSDFSAWNDIGLYFSGQITPEDHVNALKYFHRAAEHGLPDAQNNLGIAYDDGKGVPMDQVEAAKWFRLAAEQGNIFGQFNLGRAYLIGKGVPENITEAIKWFRLSAEQGESKSQRTLGIYYLEGQGGLPKDSAEAVKWWRKAAEQGDAIAQFFLGQAYDNGTGVQKDIAEAAKWFRLSAEQGDSDAQLNLGLAYLKGEGVPQNYIEAYKWANLAASTGSDNPKKLRDGLTQMMTPSQIEEGQRLASIEALKIQNPTGHMLQERHARAAIPSSVRQEVWRRDGGVCVKCGSRRNLEYDHIVPVSKGGSNTVRNIELLCEACNRSKSASIQ